MLLRRSLRSRLGRDDQPSMDANMNTRSTRAAARAAISTPAVTISRVAPELHGNSTQRSIYLTVKMPSSKLREVTSGSTRSGASTRRSVNVFTENPIVTGPRTSRPKKKLVEVDTSDEDDLEDQEEDEVDDDEDAPGEDDDDVDADGDLDMDDAPPQPPVSKRHAKAAAAAAPSGKAVKSVEAKEMELDDDDEDDDDEELSELESDAEGEPDDQDESMMANGGAEDLEGEEEDEEDDLDSDDDTPTADLSKMTKRQRGTLGNDFLQLPMEPQVKKHLTAEERAMRRAEMARRRKNLSEKRNEEEKMDTINRLLRKQAPKRRGRIPAAEAAEAASAEQEVAEPEKPDPTMVRWVSGRQGSLVGVPEEWLDIPAGRVFGGNGSGKLVQEV
ncbi:hypothetical protein ASPBRDRAFT_26999 [Aspergillus brasiliensis CBS 101740]|uniref:INO80 complex subunit B-like conserved region domain-containing protein n=1 Tax=Aspergillus brasiliensis (strain CBS 101740 / IMI 381727 / IBT 21946) TaxID=767769 RepID=A0A1L9UXY6_ASPBC|nr:hypothetical protein ASPBRDRAFT_26999 [Aspergillus brasiliensis CBS 101740]